MSPLNNFAWAAAAALTAAPASLAQVSGDSYVTREFSVMFDEAGGKAVTREFAVLFDESGGKAVTREFTVIIGDRPGHATSREVSFELPVCNVGDTAPVITGQPTAQAVCCLMQGGMCSTNSAVLSVGVSSSGGTRFRWQVEVLPGVFVPLADGTNAFAFGDVVASGSYSPDLTVSLQRVTAASLRVVFRCDIANACGTVESHTAETKLCRADVNCVGGLSIQDIFDFLNAWFAANPFADFNGMNGISIQDIFDFLNAWFAGCP